jgi:hypothetical protein
MKGFNLIIVGLLTSVVFAENTNIIEIIEKPWFEPTVKVITTLMLIASLITCLIMCRTKKIK